MGYKSGIWKLYAIRFFYNLIPAYVIERLFWEERGMTIQMVIYTEIIFAVTVVLLEMPSGMMADRWGRKKLIVLAAVIGCCEFLFLIFATTFWHFAFIIFLAAIGSSAISGAENAMLYDLLQAEGMQSQFEKHLGRLNALDIVAITMAALSGGFLASVFHFEFNYWLSFFAMTIALAFAFTLVEPVRQRNREDNDPVPLKAYFSEAVRIFIRHRGIWTVVFSGMVIGAALSYIDEFWQLYLDRIGIHFIYFGLFSSTFFLIRLPGNLLAYQLKARFSYSFLLTSVIVIFTIGFSVLAFDRGWPGILAMLLICLSAGIVEPLVTGFLHHRISSDMRATLDSFQSLGYNAVLIPTGLGFGYFSTRMDIFGGYGFIAVICGLYFIYFLFASKKWLSGKKEPL